MINPVVVDTDVLVDFFRGQPQAVAFLDAHAERIILSSIVVAELFAGVKGEAELQKLGAFVARFRIVPVDVEIARTGGLYKRDWGKSHGVGLADALLAATAVVEGAQIKTLNVKHFPMIEGLSPAYRKG